MYASLQRRYRERIMQHDLPDQMLQMPCKRKQSSLEDFEEIWSKKSVCNRKEVKTKYFHTPEVVPSSRENVSTVTINKFFKLFLFSQLPHKDDVISASIGHTLFKVSVCCIVIIHIQVRNNTIYLHLLTIWLWLGLCCGLRLLACNHA